MSLYSIGPFSKMNKFLLLLCLALLFLVAFASAEKSDSENADVEASVDDLIDEEEVDEDDT
jgi:outer membrane lipoprotein-sorting protein